MCLRNYDKKATCLRKKEKCVFDLGTQETSLLRYAVRLLGSQLQAARPIDCRLQVARLSKSRTLFIIKKFIFIVILRCSVGAIFVSPFLPLGRDYENAKTRSENAKQRCEIAKTRCENAKQRCAILISRSRIVLSRPRIVFSRYRPEGEITKMRQHDAKTRNNDARSRKYDARTRY